MANFYTQLRPIYKITVCYSFSWENFDYQNHENGPFRKCS